MNLNRQPAPRRPASKSRSFLPLLAAASQAGYVALWRWFPLTADQHRAPLPDLYTLTPSLLEGLLYGLLIVALLALCWFAFRWLERRQLQVPLWQVLLPAALFSAPLIMTFPVNASDVYNYFLHGRIVTFHHASPFTTPPDAFPADPYHELVGEWSNATAPYGPLWVLTSAAIVQLADQDPQRALILFKGLAALLHLASGGLIWLCLREATPAVRAARTLLWAWNPALLLIMVMDGHNEAMMFFWLLLGAWLVQRGRRWGLVVMTLAPLTKPIALLALPFFCVAVLQKMSDNNARFRMLLACGLGSLLLAAAAFLPFTTPAAGSSVDELMQRLLVEATQNGSFSPVALALLSLQRLGFYPAFRHITTTGAALLGALALWLTWRTVHGRPPARAAADISIGYLLQALKFRIWYSAWPFPWLVLDVKGSAYRLAAGYWFLATAQLSVLIYGHLWRLALGTDHLVSHLIGIPFVFVLPLAAAWLVHRRDRRAARPIDAIGLGED